MVWLDNRFKGEPAEIDDRFQRITSTIEARVTPVDIGVTNVVLTLASYPVYSSCTRAELDGDTLTLKLESYAINADLVGD